MFTLEILLYNTVRKKIIEKHNFDTKEKQNAAFSLKNHDKWFIEAEINPLKLQYRGDWHALEQPIDSKVLFYITLNNNLYLFKDCQFYKRPTYHEFSDSTLKYLIDVVDNLNFNT